MFSSKHVSNMWGPENIDGESPLFMGIAPHADFMEWYASKGLTTFRGNYGAVPGMADNVSSVGWSVVSPDPPTYL